MTVQAKHIEAALRAVGGYGGQKWTMQQIADGANDALKQAGITTRQGAAVFIAQCMVESAYFRTTREYGGANTRYAPYYGRGFIQVTWKDNYAKFGAWCKSKGLVSDSKWFVNSPDRLADPKWAWLGAVWYFTSNNLVGLANKGENIKVGRAVNRGNANSPYAAYGEDHRQAAYKALLNAGVTPPGAAAKTAAKPTKVTIKVDGVLGARTIKALQKYLKVTADGKIGPATARAIQKWVGVKQDGKIGPATVRALQRKLKVSADGKWGSGTTKALQKFLNSR